jgi:hypothetical protein
VLLRLLHQQLGSLLLLLLLLALHPQQLLPNVNTK